MRRTAAPHRRSDDILRVSLRGTSEADKPRASTSTLSGGVSIYWEKFCYDATGEGMPQQMTEVACFYNFKIHKTGNNTARNPRKVDKIKLFLFFLKSLQGQGSYRWWPIDAIKAGYPRTRNKTKITAISRRYFSKRHFWKNPKEKQSQITVVIDICDP